MAGVKSMPMEGLDCRHRDTELPSDYRVLSNGMTEHEKLSRTPGHRILGDLAKLSGV